MAIYVDDRELLAAHRAGETKAFDELVREHRSSLHRHAYKRLLSIESAEDAVQETLVRAYRALPNFSGEYRIGPWLHRIMHNVCVDEGNRRKKDADKTGRVAALPNSRMDSPSIEEELHLDYDDTELHGAIDELSLPYREALLLRFVDDMDYHEVAANIGITEQNARARVSRARTAMKQAFKGVAAFPFILIGLLKRGEKFAAAATSTGTVGVSVATASASSSITSSAATSMLPAFTEVASSVAPAVVPIIFKATVGIGLIAAVLTPSSDSGLHHVVSEMKSESEVLFEDSAPSLDPSLPIVVDVIVASQSESEDVESSSADNKNLMDESLSSNELEDKTLSISTEKLLFGSEWETNRQQEEVSLTSELFEATLESPNFSLVAAGVGRYGLSGNIFVSSDMGSTAGVLQPVSQLSMIDGDDGRSRIEILLAVVSDDGSYDEIRFAGFGLRNQDVMLIGGVFRAPNGSGKLVDSGTFTGELRDQVGSDVGSFFVTLKK